jgi:uncharacterized protein (DUF58 family)
MDLDPIRLDFVPTARLRRLAMVAGLAVALAVVTSHGELLVVAVVPLVLLVGVPRSGVPTGAEVSVALSTARCVEGDEVELVLTVRADGCDRVQAEPVAPPWSELTYLGASREGHETVARWTLVPGRWGRHRVGPVRLRVHAGGGAYLARASLEVGDLVVYPAAAALARAVAPTELAAPLGEHPSRSVGSGVEFAGVRPYAQGDRQRDVDWRVSARHGDLFVRQYAAERAFDLVLVLDTELDAGEPGRSSLDLTVRAATGLVQTYLRSHDRVGLVTFGGPLRWLTPATGPRQLYRVTEALMSVRPDPSELDAGSVGYGLDHLPRGLLPRRAFVALLTPLLDDGPLDAVRLMLERGFAPLVIDVLTASPTVPPKSKDAALAVRTWRMQREALTLELGNLGVAVLDWDGEAELTGGLVHAMRAARPGGRP